MSQPTYSVVGDRYTILVTGAQTGGAYAVIEATVPPGSGSPPHMHTREDEAFHVILGEFEFTVAGDVQRLGPGESLFGKRNVPHNFKNVGSKPGIMLFIVTPAGLEEYFAEVGTPLENRDSPSVPPTPKDIARLTAAAPKYGLKLAGH